MHEYWKIVQRKTIQYSLLARQVLIKCHALALKIFNTYWPRIRASIQSNLPFIKDRLYQYALLTRLNKPIGAFLLLWPTLWALWIAAEGLPDTHVFIVFFMGVFLMRSGGCVLNDFADRGFDAEVKRTRTRPIAAGNVTPGEALCVAAALVIIAFLLVLTLNRLTLQLSVVGIILAIIYPFMKRYTYLPQFFLGLAFGWGIPMAFAAQTNTVPQIAWLILIANVLWSVVYDTIYAMVDRDDDLRIGIKSTAILFDEADRVIIGGIQILLIIVLVMIGTQLELGVYYFSGVGIASCMAIYQQYLIRDRDREGCFHAFMNNNWFGAIIFLGIFLNYFF
jgi:4-hydroxybenzoate polyprenyltransferase